MTFQPIDKRHITFIKREIDSLFLNNEIYMQLDCEDWLQSIAHKRISQESKSGHLKRKKLKSWARRYIRLKLKERVGEQK